ncbi:uncharacterized protein JN550_013729 [Neoarthrinium moseri]|uniref:uncharacterized protein n=1 Tax=Neoarthrinium moseri TaxID=1658444 RepID=UPI001FDCF86F|nr:uncharacterized protein JN550_013729 [Neoarthrinium moseri]KAI1856665.1 hypothetical protein JN550_013729 [Neoarthrinium moseri]
MAKLSSGEDVVAQIDKQYVILKKNEYVLNKTQLQLLEKVIHLLTDKENLDKTLSDNQKQRKNRARQFLRSTANKSGVEAALLCIITFPITKLADTVNTCQPAISSWWELFQVPPKLQDLANDLLGMYRTQLGLDDGLDTSTLSSDVPSYGNKRSLSKATHVSDQRPAKRRDVKQSAEELVHQTQNDATIAEVNAEDEQCRGHVENEMEPAGRTKMETAPLDIPANGTLLDGVSYKITLEDVLLILSLEKPNCTLLMPNLPSISPFVIFNSSVDLSSSITTKRERQEDEFI